MAESKIVNMQGEPVRSAASERAMHSVLATRHRLAEQTGTAFGGRRDYYDVLGYQRTITFQDYLHRYYRDNIAARIIDAPAVGVWRRGVTVSGGEEFEKAWRKLERSRQVLRSLEKVDCLSGIGEFGVLLIGLHDGQPLNEPASPVDGPKDVLYLTALPQGSVDIERIETNKQSPRFGLPLTYKVNFADSTNGSPGQALSQQVHHSRIIHVAEGRVESLTRGRPRLQTVYNLMDDLQKVVGGSAEFFWRIADRGMQVDIDPEAELDKDDLDNLDAELEEYLHDIRRFIKTRGVTMQNLGSETADPRAAYNAIIDLISGATGIPRRILTGSERGQLASQEDRANWMERLDERTKFFAEPEILRPFLERLISLGALPEPEDEVPEVDWAPMEAMTEMEKVQNSQRLATAAKSFQQAQFQFGGAPFTEEELRRTAGFDGEKPNGT